MSSEPEPTPTRPWYRRRGVWGVLVALAGFGGGYLYSVAIGCHTG